jgi:ribosomal-protein-alanine N-acetyltransferase
MSQQVLSQLRDMNWADVDAVLQIEQQVHTHPWTRGNINDALATGNICKVYEEGNTIVAYAILMPALGDVDLLDISVAQDHQRKGVATKLLNKIKEMISDAGFDRMMLEVRRSNVAASALYRQFGFTEVGLRRDYYPLSEGREDAIVMEYKLK